MKLIQVSFSGNANLITVRAQLIKLAIMENVKFTCCFLNRKMVEEKGFDTKIVDMLDDILGDRLTWLADSYESFDHFICNIDEARMEIAHEIDNIYVLDSATAKGVSREIELFTLGKVVLM